LQAAVVLTHHGFSYSSSLHLPALSAELLVHHALTTSVSGTACAVQVLACISSSIREAGALAPVPLFKETMFVIAAQVDRLLKWLQAAELSAFHAVYCRSLLNHVLSFPKAGSAFHSFLRREEVRKNDVSP
jgi:hypothetical protein